MSTRTHVRRSSAPRVLLASRAHVDLQDSSLISTHGAEQVISAIQSRKSVTKLFLDHNGLADDGAQKLFRYLSTEGGRRYRIAEITLNANNIGNKGLEAIAEYLEGNECLRELYLQANDFQGNIEIALKLSRAINLSKLELLSIAQNEHLTDTFFVPFISSLDSSALRELQVTVTGLTRQSAPALLEFLASPRARCLEILKCNANSLGERAARRIVAKLRTTNFTLQKLELYANAVPGEEDEEREPGEGNGGGRRREGRREESLEEARARWTACEQDLKKILLRNELLRRKLHKEALVLLTYARTLLFCSARRQQQSNGETATHILNSPLNNYQQTTLGSNSDSPTAAIASSSSSTPASYFPFRALPTELQHYTLALFAPSLSASQRARIFAFAADPNTLRPLLPSLRPRGPSSNSFSNTGCIPDPASLPFGGGIPSGSPGAGPLGPGSGLSSPESDPGRLDLPHPRSLPFLPTNYPNPKPNPSSTSPLTTTPTPASSAIPPGRGLLGSMMCSGGKCMGAGGSVLCHRMEARMRWFAEVGCARFEPEGRTKRDVILLIQ